MYSAAITKVSQTNASYYPFCLLIPTWNNLAFLQLCIRSIRQNTQQNVQIIVIINEGSDGTLAWVAQQNDIDYIHAPQNIGICYGLNIARSLIKSDYVMYVNDDMYLLPNWDTAISEEIKSIGHQQFMLSCTMIEPTNTNNPCVVVRNYGQNIAEFDEITLLNEYNTLYRNDWNGSTWPPNIVHLDLWDKVGGLSIEYSPGMYSDPDFSRKLYEAGVRYFKGKGNSLVYHFGTKTTKRIKKNKGKKTFLLKWGITARTFMQQYLAIGKAFSPLPDKTQLSTSTRLINRIKQLLA